MPGLAPGDYDGKDLVAQRCLRRYRAWVLAEFAPYLGGTIVEVGAGLGSYSKSLVEVANRLDLVEPSTALAPKLSARFAADARVRVFPESAESWLGHAPDDSYDSVLLINVLEHIADDSEVLRRLSRVLKPGGHLLLFVPALPWLYGPVDRLVGHHRRYTIKDLKAKTAAAGYRVVMARYFDLLGIAPWWIVHTLLGVTRFHDGLLGVYDRIGVPATRTIEKLIPPPFGKNIILAARRPPESRDPRRGNGAGETATADDPRSE
ncbi:MAG: class I SAM-dependent methyltransferase [Proteobacteria bacterium]|nr:class I SAM-dependent methyltransferase [Pseudomonadota bacterium]